jgi:hypothetical protein
MFGFVTFIAHVVPIIPFQKKSYAGGEKGTRGRKNVARLFEVPPIKIGKFVLNRKRAAVLLCARGFTPRQEGVASPSRSLAAPFRKINGELVLCKKIQLL